LFVGSLSAAAQEAPVTLLRTVPLPGIVGDFDHLTVDFKRHHLFVSAEVHQSIEVFDLESGKHLKSVGGFKTPHAIAFAAAKDELMVADGGDSTLVLVSGETLERVGQVPLIAGTAGGGDSPDAATYDPANQLYYIGNGGESAGTPDSVISMYSVMKGEIIGKIAIPGNNVESMAVDNAHHRLYVNIRDKQEVGVVDLVARKVIATWTAPGLKGNTALSFNESSQQLFVAGRNPGIFHVFDMTGKEVSRLQCVDKNDDMTWDPVMKRVYISGSQGLSIFHQDAPLKYTEIANLPTNGGKTSLYVPAVKQFYVIHPKTDVDGAALLVYRVNP
jgi:DNA-binding beta-propeller fold protein YncE